MKTQYLIVALVVLPVSLLANDRDTSAKEAFFRAKANIEAMLDGSQPITYEKAIYEIENAWWNGGISYTSYREALTYHEGNVRKLLGIYRNTSKPTFQNDLVQTKEEKQRNYDHLLSNYAIYRYMATCSFWQDNGDTTCHLPYSYQTADPMGTTDWTNTQVSHLLNENTGNCFALASLFKILSDRLNSDARLCTAPGHIYIRHCDERGTFFNIEVSSHSFPGTGTIETLTYTPDEAVKNKVSLREINVRQSVALCLVYLAKGYQYKFHETTDDFLLQCAETALQYDDHSLNAMLLKAEVLESRLLARHANGKWLESNPNFATYQEWIAHVYRTGYREMPQEMKNILIKGWAKDTLAFLATADHTPQHMHNNNALGGYGNNQIFTVNTPHIPTRYASLSWGLFDEEIRTKPVERYGKTLFDTKQQKIVGFDSGQVIYNDYIFDPVIFALNVDPLAHKLPQASPYAYCLDNPIIFSDPDGAYPVLTITKQRTGYTAIRVYGHHDVVRIVPTYKAVLTDVRNGKTTYLATYNVTRDGYYDIGNAKGKVVYEDRSFEPKKKVGKYTATKFEYPQGIPALALRENGSSGVDATPLNNHTFLDGTPLPREVNRKDPDKASGVMVHIGGAYEHEDGSDDVTIGGTYGCFGVINARNVYKTVEAAKKALEDGTFMKNTSNVTMDDMSKRMDDANKKDPGADKIGVDIEKR